MEASWNRDSTEKKLSESRKKKDVETLNTSLLLQIFQSLGKPKRGAPHHAEFEKFLPPAYFKVIATGTVSVRI